MELRLRLRDRRHGRIGSSATNLGNESRYGSFAIWPYSRMLVCLVFGLLITSAPVVAWAQCDPPSVEPIGSLDLPGQAVHISGDAGHAYVDFGNQELSVVDVSDPSNPVVVGTIPWAGLSTLVGDILYVASGGNGLRIVNVATPTAPELLGTLETPGSFSDIAVDGTFAYLTEVSFGLHVVDVSDPMAPVLRASVAMPKAGSVTAAGGYAYVVVYPPRSPQDPIHRTIQVVDVRIPTAPAIVATIEDIGGDRYMDLEVRDGYLYAIRAQLSALTQNQPYGLRVYDVAVPSDPRFVTQLRTPGHVRRLALEGDRAYVADGYWGLQIIDISEPTAPVRIASSDTPGRGYDVYAAGGFAFVADREGDLQVVPIDALPGPEFVGAVDTPGFARSVALDGDRAYVADGEAGVQIVDIADPAAPNLLGAVDTPGVALDVAIAGTRAYIADGPAGLTIADVADPAAATVIESVDTPGNAVAVAVSDPYVYVADGAAGLQVIDLSDPGGPTLVGAYGVPGMEMLDVVVLGDEAYVAAGTTGPPDGASSLLVFDVSDPTQPSQIRSVDLEDDMPSLGVAQSAGLVLSADGLQGVKIIDARAPAAARVIRFERSAGEVVDVAATSGYIYAAVADVGLLQIDVRETPETACCQDPPINPARVARLPTAGAASGVAVAAGYAYVADGDAGLRIARMCPLTSCRDRFEEDGSLSVQRKIANGETQTHSICPVGDRDHVTFEVDAPSAIVIETTGPSGDTRIFLYHGSSVIGSDDDSGSGRFARLERACGVDALEAGSYTVRVEEAGLDEEIFSYDIRLETRRCSEPTGVRLVADAPSPQRTGTLVTFSAEGEGGSGIYEYQFLGIGAGTDYEWTILQPWSPESVLLWDTSANPGSNRIGVWVHNVGSSVLDHANADLPFEVTITPATGVTLVPDLPSPQAYGTTVTFGAEASGGAPPHQYRFLVKGPETDGVWEIVQDYGDQSSFVMDTSAYPKTHRVAVWVHSQGSIRPYDALASLVFVVETAPATSVTLTPDPPSPHGAGGPIQLTAVASGGAGPYEYRFWVLGPATGGIWAVARDWDANETWTWDPGESQGASQLGVWARSVGSPNPRDATDTVPYQIVLGAAQSVTLQASPPSPEDEGRSIEFIAEASGDAVAYEYAFWLKGPETEDVWRVVRGYQPSESFTWQPSVAGLHEMSAWARADGSTRVKEATAIVPYRVRERGAGPVESVVLRSGTGALFCISAGARITWTATAEGGSGDYEYRFLHRSPTTDDIWVEVQSYGPANTWVWDVAGAERGKNGVGVWVRNVGSPVDLETADANVFCVD